MSTKQKILIITGDAGESYECLYAKHRFEEAGYQPVIAGPTKVGIRTSKNLATLLNPTSLLRK
jgi:hypothetical protein